MYILVSYDVATTDREGRKRLRQIAKICQDYGQRVQNSVFECCMETSLFYTVKAKLLEIADLNKDSIRFYFLGRNLAEKVEHYGIKPSYSVTDPFFV